MEPVNVIEMDLGLEPGGEAHNKFASLCMEKMNKTYVPKDNGALISSSYVDNECNIHYNTPYAHYMYYGKLYVMDNGKGAYYSPEYGFWSDKGKKKTLTDRDLVYHTPGTGAHWDTLMVNVEAEDIRKRMEEFVKARGKK